MSIKYRTGIALTGVKPTPRFPRALLVGAPTSQSIPNLPHFAINLQTIMISS